MLIQICYIPDSSVKPLINSLHVELPTFVNALTYTVITQRSAHKLHTILSILNPINKRYVYSHPQSSLVCQPMNGWCYHLCHNAAYSTTNSEQCCKTSLFNYGCMSTSFYGKQQPAQKLFMQQQKHNSNKMSTECKEHHCSFSQSGTWISDHALQLHCKYATVALFIESTKLPIQTKNNRIILASYLIC